MAGRQAGRQAMKQQGLAADALAQLIAEREVELVTLREALALLTRQASPPAAKARRSTTSRKPAGGSIGDRIIEILTEAKTAMSLIEIEPKAKCSLWHVRSVMADLVDEKRVVRLGEGRATRYALPQFPKGA